MTWNRSPRGDDRLLNDGRTSRYSTLRLELLTTRLLLLLLDWTLWRPLLLLLNQLAAGATRLLLNNLTTSSLHTRWTSLAGTWPDDMLLNYGRLTTRHHLLNRATTCRQRLLNDLLGRLVLLLLRLHALGRRG